MICTRDGERITLVMTTEDFDRLLLICGFAIGAAKRQDDRIQFYSFLQFVNELNATNPNFMPYEIPSEYKAGGTQGYEPA